jgi:hypothetical protein
MEKRPSNTLNWVIRWPIVRILIVSRSQRKKVIWWPAGGVVGVLITGFISSQAQAPANNGLHPTPRARLQGKEVEAH